MRSPAQTAPRWLVWAALWVVYIVWGSTYLAIRIVVETIPPLLGASVRFLVAGAVAYLVLLARRGVAGVRVSAREALAAAIVGTLLLLGGNGLVTIAEQDVPSGLAALIIASVPLWVAGLRSVIGDRIDRGTLVGVVVGLLGVAVLVLPGRSSAGAALGGMLLLVAAAGFWATGSLMSSRLPLPADPFTSTAVQMLLGGLTIAVAGLLRGEGSGFDVASFSTASIAGLAYLVVAGSLLAFTAYTWLLQNAPISKVATYAYVNPVIALGLGWLLLAETITPLMLVAAGVILVSVAVIVRRETAVAAADETPALAEPEPDDEGQELLEPVA